VGLWIIGLEAQRLVVVPQRVSHAARAKHGLTKIVVGAGIRRIFRNRVGPDRETAALVEVARGGEARAAERRQCHHQT
jgi:hypothetical protein